MDCVCMKFEATVSYIGKYFKLDQTIRDLTCGICETLLMVIQLGETGLEQTGFVCFHHLFEVRGEKGRWHGLI